ncbi:MAG: polysaccharide deacetylase [Ruminococcaceae bacterium]|nr:polysaccharide deacetylase [Oscillospiraceae bacterium]
MLKQRKTILLYFSFAVIFVFAIGGYFYTEKPSEYQKAIKKIEYQLGYRDVYATKNDFTHTDMAVQTAEMETKTVYLTFDDGPSPRTLEILDILKEYNIKATFFILSDEKETSKDIVKRIYNEGHTIGVHSASHSYEKIYKSVDHFLNDFEICFNYIKDIIGEAPNIFRFPGGSVNSYNKNICKDLVDEMTRRGFIYFDWNVSSDDAVKGYTEESIYNNIINGCKSRKVSVVLMHDSAPKKATVAALKKAIPELISQGYVFDRLDETAQPTVFKIE